MLVRTWTFWLFVLTGFAEVGLLLLLGDAAISVRGLVVMCALLAWVGRGSRIAWGLFAAGNALMLVATWALVLASDSHHASGGASWANLAGGSTNWADVAVVSLGSVALLAMLFAPAMRKPRPAGV